MRREFAGWMFILGAILSGCELEGVAAPPPEDLLIAEAVLRAGAERQYVLLHRSLEGRVIRGEPGASIRVTSESGIEVAYGESELGQCLLESPMDWEIEDLEVGASCYLSAVEAGRFVQPGQQYELSIRTQRGEILRGRTTVPRPFSFRVPEVEVDPASLATTCVLPNHTFTLTWTRSDGAWAYITSLRLSAWGDDLREEGVEVPDPLDLSGVSVSAADTSLVFPANLGLFQRVDLDQRVLLALQDGLPQDSHAELAIVAADRNYTNWVRGGRFNPSGNVRGSSIAGEGVGVFGAIVPLVIRSPDPTNADPPGTAPAQCPVPDPN